MRKKTLLAFSALAIGLSGLTGIATNPAAAQETPIPGAIHTGDCASVGDVVASLSAARMSAGQPVGNDDAVPATSSFSTIPLSLETLGSSDHVVLISHPSQDRTLACGEIGGFADGDGALVLGLRAEDGSGVTGVAYLRPGADPDLTDVSLFVAGESLATLGNDPAAADVGNAPAGATPDTATQSTAEASTPRSADDGAGKSVDIEPYVDEVVRITGAMAASFDDLAPLFENPQYEDETWRADVAAQFAIWRISYEEALQLSPPPGLEEVHALLVEGLRLYSEASVDAEAGFDPFDIDQISLASEKMAQASELLQEAAALVQAMEP